MKKKSIGQVLRDARQAKDLTVEQVSEDLELPMQYITVMELNQFKFVREGQVTDYLTRYGDYLELDSQLLLEGYQNPDFEIEVDEDEPQEEEETAGQEQEPDKWKWLRSERFDYVEDDPNRRLPLVILSLLSLLMVGLIGTAVYFQWEQEASATAPRSSLKAVGSSTQQTGPSESSTSSQSSLTAKTRGSYTTVKLTGDTPPKVTIEISQDFEDENLIRVTNSDLDKKGLALGGENKSVTITLTPNIDKTVITLDKVDHVTVKINGQTLDLSNLNKDNTNYITLTLN
ncbi:helix-turn-helix domain-containing protein [Streptococcus dentasini]